MGESNLGTSSSSLKKVQTKTRTYPAWMKPTPLANVCIRPGSLMVFSTLSTSDSGTFRNCVGEPGRFCGDEKEGSGVSASETANLSSSHAHENICGKKKTEGNNLRQNTNTTTCHTLWWYVVVCAANYFNKQCLSIVHISASSIHTNTTKASIEDSTSPAADA